jgi:hypothetical protein
MAGSGEQADKPDVEGLDPSIARIQERYPINGVMFSELQLETMSLDELDSVLSQIRRYQLSEQEEFFASWDEDNLSVISDEEYHLRQLWLFDDIVALPVRRDGVLSGEHCLVGEADCSEIYALREMVRAVRRVEAYAAREREAFASFVESVSRKFPSATLMANGDKTVAYFIDASGAILAGRVLSTIGNF